MSRISFEYLMAKRPDLTEAWLFLAKWLENHPRVKTVGIDRLATADRTLSAGMLAEALRVLRDGGLVREVYQIRDSDGTYLPVEYESLKQIPSRVPDRFHEYVSTAELDVVPAFSFELVPTNVPE